MSDVAEVTSQNFEEEVLKSEKPVLVDFWAPWCGPCRMLTPHVEALAKETADRLKVVKLNTDEAQDIAGRYNVLSIPTLILFKGGQIVEQLVGMMPKQQIASKIEPHLA
jgi:thioredoxin 1